MKKKASHPLAAAGRAASQLAKSRRLRRDLLASGALVAVLAATGTAGAAGSSTVVAPFSNSQPSLVLNEVVDVAGIYPSQTTGATNGNTTGFVYTLAAMQTPSGSAPASGQLLSISAQGALFSLIGTDYGGNGMTNFALPNLGGQLVVGTGGEFPMGQTLGSSTVSIRTAQLPPPQGSGQPFDNVQPSLVLQPLINIGGNYPSGDQATFLGEIAYSASSLIPNGWAAADGQILSIAGNTALFSVLGTTYGGNGITNFALPDLQGRVAVGADAAIPLGAVMGQNSETLSQVNLSGVPVDDDQASLAVNYLIAIQGDYPTDSFNSSVPLLGEIVADAGDDEELLSSGDWAQADGQLLPIAGNEGLFNVLGTTYGGNGITDFALPDLDGRAVVGESPDDPLGQMFGADEVDLLVTVTTASVPEPSSWALMMAGLAAAGFARRRTGRRSRAGHAITPA